MKKLIVCALVALFMLTACKAENTPQIKTAEKDETVTLYFADKDAKGLIPETRSVFEKTPESALSELLLGTNSENCIDIIGEGTKLLKYTNDSGDVTIDLSKEFLDSYTDTLVIYSVVNTVTEFPDINFVSITVEGEKNSQLGNYLLSEKFTRNNSIILE